MANEHIDTEIIEEVFPEFTNPVFIASGGYKQVFRVTTHDGNTEALKVIQLPPAGAGDEEKALREQELGRALRETKLIGECASPFIVKLGTVEPHFRYVDGADCVVYTEEYLEGPNLVEARSAGHVPDEVECRALLRCLALAVGDLWKNHRTVHRDIKPRNIIKTDLQDRPFVLLDLGIAYDVTKPGLTDRPFVNIPGTLLYLAPEMAMENFRENLDYRSDLYTSGITTYEYATGGHPLARSLDNTMQTMSRILRMEPKKLRLCRPDFSPAFGALVDQLMKKNPILRGTLEGTLKSLPI